MLTSFASFLRDLQLKEQAILSAQNITHGPTIGDMYEGLTHDLLSRAIPASAGLRLVDGFVVAHDDTLSPQIDCMLVRGEGERVPYTNHQKWPVKDVIAVFEIKKNLYTAQLQDSYAKLKTVLESYSNWIESRASDGTTQDVRPAFQAFAKLTGIYPKNYDDVHKLPEPLEYVFHTLVMEHLSPVRVVFAYDGFVDEFGLREGFIKYLETHGSGRHGFGVGSLPTLVICGQSSIVKMNGCPYTEPMDPDGWWAVLASNAENPLRILLELIWTRLSFALEMEMPSDDTLQDEALHHLLSARLARSGDKLGWEYDYTELSKEKLQSAPAPRPWEPIEIDSNEYTLLTIATKQGQIDLSEPQFLDWVRAEGIDADTLVSRLIETRLVARTGSAIRLIDRTLFTAFTPDGKSWAATDSDRFQLWSAERMKHHPKK
jgi:hypothetical protein